EVGAHDGSHAWNMDAKRCRGLDSGDPVRRFPRMPTHRAELIHIDVDRRLGHEWDEWDGTPLPDRGNFAAPPLRFFAWSLIALLAATTILAALLYLLMPRIGLLLPTLPTILWWTGAVVVAAGALWWLLIAVAYLGGVALLPAPLAERGLFL